MKWLVTLSIILLSASPVAAAPIWNGAIGACISDSTFPELPEPQVDHGESLLAQERYAEAKRYYRQELLAEDFMQDVNLRKYLFAVAMEGTDPRGWSDHLSELKRANILNDRSMELVNAWSVQIGDGERSQIQPQEIQLTLTGIEKDRLGVMEGLYDVTLIRLLKSLQSSRNSFPEAEYLYHEARIFEAMQQVFGIERALAAYQCCIGGDNSSDIGSQCFDRYRELTLFYYTGSSGTHLPQEVLDTMRTLKRSLDGQTP